MAVKKVTEPVQETEAAEVQEEEKPYDPWQDMREVILPRMTGQKSKYFSVNSYSCQIPLGKPVTVPYPIYVLAQEYITSLTKQDEIEADIPNRG